MSITLPCANDGGRAVSKRITTVFRSVFLRKVHGNEVEKNKEQFVHKFTEWRESLTNMKI